MEGRVTSAVPVQQVAPIVRGNAGTGGSGPSVAPMALEATSLVAALASVVHSQLAAGCHRRRGERWRYRCSGRHEHPRRQRETLVVPRHRVARAPKVAARVRRP